VSPESRSNAPSDDAGLYVCEHVGFTAIGLARRRGIAAAGFIHVPPPDALPIERQLSIPLAVLGAVFAPPATTT
jgi:pyrrolidone-carboxylate peptidase